jgi:hypothetical protein
MRDLFLSPMSTQDFIHILAVPDVNNVAQKPDLWNNLLVRAK